MLSSSCIVAELNVLPLFVIAALNPPRVNVVVVARAATATRAATSPRLLLRMRRIRDKVGPFMVCQLSNWIVDTTGQNLNAATGRLPVDLQREPGRAGAHHRGRMNAGPFAVCQLSNWIVNTTGQNLSAATGRLPVYLQREVRRAGAHPIRSRRAAASLVLRRRPALGSVQWGWNEAEPTGFQRSLPRAADRSSCVAGRFAGLLRPEGHLGGARVAPATESWEVSLARRAQPAIATSSASFADGFMNPSVSPQAVAPE